VRPVKCRVEASNLRRAGKRGGGSGNACEVMRLVQGRERIEGGKRLHQAVSDNDGLDKLKPAVNDPMANGGNVHLGELLLDHRENGAQRPCMVGHEALALDLGNYSLAFPILHRQVRLVAKALDLTAGDAVQRARGEQRELQRR
jgi:hypothetical protein